MFFMGINLIPVHSDSRLPNDKGCPEDSVWIGSYFGWDRCGSDKVYVYEADNLEVGVARVSRCDFNTGDVVAEAPRTFIRSGRSYEELCALFVEPRSGI